MVFSTHYQNVLLIQHHFFFSFGVIIFIFIFIFFISQELLDEAFLFLPKLLAPSYLLISVVFCLTFSLSF